VEFKTGTTEVCPPWPQTGTSRPTASPTPSTWREGVTFHDGTPFNADAVVFSYMRQLDEDQPYYEYGPWKYWGYMDMSNIVDSITAVDDLTVSVQT
jgi:ABC-type transport system substrate-binding protein